MFTYKDNIKILKRLINLTIGKKVTWNALSKNKYKTTFENLTFIIKKRPGSEYERGFEFIVSNSAQSINDEFTQQGIEDFCMAHDLFTIASKSADVPLYTTLGKFINRTDY